LPFKATVRLISLEDVFISVVDQARQRGLMCQWIRGQLVIVRPKRIIAQALKELTQLGRDRLTLALALVLPLIQLLFGFAVSLDVNNINLAIQDLISRPLAASPSSAPTSSGWLPRDLKSRVTTNQGKVAAGLIVPAEPWTFLGAGVKPVQILVDGTDANTANLVRAMPGRLPMPLWRICAQAVIRPP